MLIFFTIIIVTALSYLSVSFILLDLDVTRWSIEDRVYVVANSALVLLFTLISIMFEDKVVIKPKKKRLIKHITAQELNEIKAIINGLHDMVELEDKE